MILYFSSFFFEVSNVISMFDLPIFVGFLNVAIDWVLVYVSLIFFQPSSVIFDFFFSFSDYDADETLVLQRSGEWRVGLSWMRRTRGLWEDLWSSLRIGNALIAWRWYIWCSSSFFCFKLMQKNILLFDQI